MAERIGNWSLKRCASALALAVAALLLGMCVGLFGNVEQAHAANGGTFNGVTWSLSDDGVLTIGDGGEQTFTDGVSGYSAWPWYQQRSDVKSVAINGTVHGPAGSVSGMFYGMTNCTSIDLSGFDTSDVTDMNHMFYDCSKLSSLDVTGFDTSNVTDMSSMFYYCYTLASLDVSGFDTSKVKDMRSMFRGSCTKSASLDLSNFNTSNVTNMRQMFQGSNVWSLDISSFDTSKVTDMTNMFDLTQDLYRVKLGAKSPFVGKTSSVKTSLYGSDVYHNWTRSDGAFGPYQASEMGAVYDGASMAGVWVRDSDIAVFDEADGSMKFYDEDHARAFEPTSTQTVYRGFETIYPMNSTQIDWKDIREKIVSVGLVGDKVSPVSTAFWFAGCKNLKTVDMGKLDTGKLREVQSTFQNCTELTDLDISGWDMSKVTNMNNMYYNCTKLQQVKLGESNPFTGSGSTVVQLPSNQLGGERTGRWVRSDFAYGPYTPVELRENYASSMAGTWVLEYTPIAVFDSADGSLKFYNGTTARTFEPTATQTVYTGFYSVSYSYASNVPWYANRASITSVEVVDEGISPVSTRYWFDGCSELVDVDLSKLDTSNVMNMGNMFDGCSSLTSLDLSSFDTSKVTNMSCMFFNCVRLASLDLSNFSTGNVTNMGQMFYNSGIGSLDISSFDTSKVTNMMSMFDACGKLSRVELGEYNPFVGKTASVTAALPANKLGGTHTGKWVRDDESYGPYTPAELRDNYTSAMQGIWVLEKVPTEYTLTFASDLGTGSMSTVKVVAAEPYKIPDSGFFYPGKKVARWDDGNGHVFEAGGIIPANTYTAGDKVTLTAVWEDMNQVKKAGKGTYEIELQPGMQATIPDVPAGTPYRVYEQTEDGWVLVQQSNTTGTIQPLQTSTASFTNQYAPEVTSAVLYGMKTLDNRAAEAGSYSFELWEGDELLQTKPVVEGGAIVFDPIVYDAQGQHVYTVKEVLGNDETLTYDTHEETVTVLVQDVDAHLTARVEYDSDGIKFNNRHNPGNLVLTKDVVGQTSANADDEFTFKVTLRNPNGEPVSEGVYLHYSE